MYVGLSASPYYTLCWKSYKMNNNLYFNRNHPLRVYAKHAETIKKSTSLRTSAFDQTLFPVSVDVLYGQPLGDRGDGVEITLWEEEMAVWE